MRTSHALILAVSVAIAAVAGTYAAMRTTHLGAASARPLRISTAAIADRNRALDRAQAALRAQLRLRPPALPRAPRQPAPVASSAQLATFNAGATRTGVIYVRPKPIVRVVHRHGGERDDRGGGGGAFDD